jgi:hypothetical protein
MLHSNKSTKFFDLNEDEIKDKFLYNPDKKYYFLSVLYCGNAPAWIRRPFQTDDEIGDFLEVYSLSKIGTYQQLEIFDESLLREKIKVMNKEGGYVDINLRHWIFDDSYTSDDKFYTDIISGETHMFWKDGYDDWLKVTNESKTVV